VGGENELVPLEQAEAGVAEDALGGSAHDVANAVLPIGVLYAR